MQIVIARGKLIYTCKLTGIEDKKIAEFNYKLLNNILCNNLYLSKWNANKTSTCETCNKDENTKHLIFDCLNSIRIWEIISISLSIDIQWKHVIVGFYNERNKKCTSLNTLISYVAYRIYKYKMYCRLESLKETDTGIQNHIKESLYGYSKVVKRLNTLIDYKLFNRIAQIL